MKSGLQMFESAELNKRTYMQYFDRLQNYALNMFEWTGLPETVNQRFMELTMLRDGQICFFNDKDYGIIALPVMLGGHVNIYNEPTQNNVVTIGYDAILGVDESVIMYNNFLRTPVIPVLEAYAYRLYEVERTLDVNIKAQKTPIIIKCTEQQRLTLIQLYMKFDGNEPFIFGDKNLDLSGFEVLQTNAPFVGDKLMLYKHDLWNEAMSYLGIGNGNTDKKERLVADEAKANDEQIEGSRFIMLNARKEACAKINKMFDLNIDVKFRLENDDIPEEVDSDESGD